MIKQGVGPFPHAHEEYDPVWARELVDRLDLLQSALIEVIQTGYTTSNGTVNRTLDANGSTVGWGGSGGGIDDLSDILATLIDDFAARGVLSD